MDSNGQPKPKPKPSEEEEEEEETVITIKEGSFFQQAEWVAERNVREWIRKTLREVFLQAFQRCLHLELEDEKTARLSTEDLGRCMELVQRVSDAWKEELLQHKHSRTGEWVQDVWDSGQANLWSVELTVDRWKEYIQHQKGVPRVEATTGAQLQVDTDTTVDDSSKNDGDGGSGRSSGDGNLLEVPYCQLRKLGRQTTCKFEEVDGDNDALSKLKTMGQEKQSYWPLDHQIVDDTARTIPKRQRWEKRESSKSMNYQVVVPKSSSATQDKSNENEQEEEGEELSPENATAQRILSDVLERAKNKIKSSRQGPKRKRGRQAKTIVSQRKENPRPPSMVASSTHKVNEELTAQEKEDLDRLIHTDDESMDPDGRSTVSIFGALQDLGKIHATIQEEKKRSQGRVKNPTEKQRRRQERAYIKERLAPHRIQKNQDPQTYRSKVLKTEQDCEDGTTKNFLEFDLGWSLLEYEEGGEKRLMAFSSIQASIEEPSPAGASSASLVSRDES